MKAGAGRDESKRAVNACHRQSLLRLSYQIAARTDGNRTAPGYLGASVDTAGPAMDVLGSVDA